MNFLSRNLVFLRTKHNMSQLELANRLNKRQTAVSSWEKEASRPNVDDLLVLTDIFGITLSELVEVNLSQAKAQTHQPSTNRTGKSKKIGDEKETEDEKEILYKELNKSLQKIIDSHAKNIDLLEKLLHAKEIEIAQLKKSEHK